MVFSSLFFVYVFLPLNLLFYRLAKDIHAKNTVMLVFSLIFYSWNGPKYLLLLLFMTFTAWIAALFIEYAPEKKKNTLIICSAILLALLVYFKYLGFFVEIFDSITKADIDIPKIVLPIGVSFYTFQILSYVVDVYRGEVKAQRKFFLLLLYVSMFHQCIAGPIIRYKDVENDILHRKKDYYEIAEGVRRFCYGLAKKAIIANSIAKVADEFLITSDAAALSSVSATGLWLGALAFTFQIYFDFSAYSDMAIGMGLMTGFHYKENFNLPYMSGSVTEFWRRWHISLSSFFRDYVYIPLGGNRRGNVFFNLFVVWFLTGMWHGASLNYILWGLYFFVFLVIEKLFLKKILNLLPGFIGLIYAFVIIVFGWVLFKFEDMDSLFMAVKCLFAKGGNPLVSIKDILAVKNNIFLMAACFLASSSIPENLKSVLTRSKNFFVRDYLMPFYDTAMPLILLIWSSLALIGDSYNPFLYFQF